MRLEQSLSACTSRVIVSTSRAEQYDTARAGTKESANQRLQAVSGLSLTTDINGNVRCMRDKQRDTSSVRRSSGR